MEWLKEAVFVAGVVSAVMIPAGRWAAKVVVEKAVERKFREWEVRFSTFHGRLVEAMEAIRGAIAKASEAVEDYERRSQYRTRAEVESELREVQQALRHASLEIQSRSFYFDPDARQSVQAVVEALSRAAAGVRWQLYAEEQGHVERAKEAAEVVTAEFEELEKATEELDQLFRQVAGGEATS